MIRTIKGQFISSFILIACLIIGAISLTTLILVNRHFDRYIVERQEDRLAEIKHSLEFSFVNEAGNWDLAEIEKIGESALDSGIDITVYSNENERIWQTTKQSMGHMRMNGKHHKMMNQENQNTDLEYVEKNVVLKDGKQAIGQVQFGYYGPLTYSDHDVDFISAMRRSLILIAIFALTFSLFFATWVARKLSLPLIQVNRFTQAIAKGHYNEKTPPKSSTKEVNELIISVQDLSNQLEQQEELRNRLSSDISHEIRTPLTTLKGHIEAMLDGVWEPTPERLKSCYEEVNRLSRLIGDIDKITALEAQQEVVRKSRFDLYQLAQTVALTFEPLIFQKGIQFELTGEKTFIDADQDKISQIILNLLSNALKFTESGGKIQVKVKIKEQFAVLIVEDSGCGIDSTDLEHIFDRFYMADDSRKQNNEGQGIGLAIVKSIVKAHDGTVSVSSTVNLGTRFIIQLPLANTK